MGKLASYLQEHGLTQSRFAERVGCSSSYLSELLAGAKTPGLKLAIRIEAETRGKVPVKSWFDTTETAA